MNEIVKTLQRNLNKKGHKLKVDGQLGPLTYKAFFDEVAGRDTSSVGVGYAKAAAKHFQAYLLVTPQRICHFTAHMMHETGGLRYLRELGSGDKDGDGFDDYLQYLESREDLGNTKAKDGDGERTRGRGPFHLTGTNNYREYGRELGIDLLADPDIVARDHEVGMLTALLYWRKRNIGPLADKDDLRATTRKINGGLNGFKDRAVKLDRAKALFGL